MLKGLLASKIGLRKDNSTFRGCIPKICFVLEINRRFRDRRFGQPSWLTTSAHAQENVDDHVAVSASLWAFLFTRSSICCRDESMRFKSDFVSLMYAITRSTTFEPS